jgi:hypothetical protein
MVEPSFGFIGFGKTSIPNQGSTFQKTNLDGCDLLPEILIPRKPLSKEKNTVVLYHR